MKEYNKSDIEKVLQNNLVELFFSKKISHDNKNLIKKIILATSGDKKQNIDDLPHVLIGNMDLIVDNYGLKNK